MFLISNWGNHLIAVSGIHSCEGYLGDYELKVRDYPFFCGAGINTDSVRYDGTISGCLSIRSRFDQGNIYKDNFMDVWNNRFWGQKPQVDEAGNLF